MQTNAANTFKPDYAIHPGEVLDERLEAMGMKKTEFADRCDLSPKTVSQIIAGKAPVTPENAVQFERVLGVSADVWNNLDAQYRLHQVRKKVRLILAKNIEWAKRFPVKDLVDRGYIEKPANSVDRVRKLLRFLGVANVAAYDTWYKRLVISYRQSAAFECSNEALACWLRIGELEAEKIRANAYEKIRFQTALDKIRHLTDIPPDKFEPAMKKLCADAGVAVVFVGELPKTRISGAARWLAQDRALIMLSLRYKTDDRMWFTFFHEAGHILLHGKKEVFIDAPDGNVLEKEAEADRFAANWLIPDHAYRNLTVRGVFSRNAILSYAKKLGVAPGIVVGRLQHDHRIPYNRFNDLKRKFTLSD